VRAKKAIWCKSKLGRQLHHDLWFLRITGTKRDFADLEDDEEELYPSKKVLHRLQSPVILSRNSVLLLQIQTSNWIAVDLYGCVTMLLSCILLQWILVLLWLYEKSLNCGWEWTEFVTPDALHKIGDQIIVVCIWDVHLSVFLSTDLCFNWTWKWSCHHNNSQSTGQVSILHFYFYFYFYIQRRSCKFEH
jgi:hypothetical protein